MTYAARLGLSPQALYNGVVETIEEELIAPCGMNCGVCISYLAMKADLNKKGFARRYCIGCRPRGKNCTFLAGHCARIGKGLVQFCYDCHDFACRRLETLDKRYRASYRMSMIANLEVIREYGIKPFLQAEAVKWRCPECGGVICCHNGLCLDCGLDKLRRNRKYRWGERR